MQCQAPPPKHDTLFKLKLLSSEMQFLILSLLLQRVGGAGKEGKVGERCSPGVQKEERWGWMIWREERRCWWRRGRRTWTKGRRVHASHFFWRAEPAEKKLHLMTHGRHTMWAELPSLHVQSKLGNRQEKLCESQFTHILLVLPLQNKWRHKLTC